MNIETNPMKGMIFCLLSYFFIALIGIFEKSISHSVTIPIILLFQSATCLLLNGFGLLKSKTKSLKPHQPFTYCIRIASGAGCYAALFYIIRFIPISEAMLYQYSATLWIPFIMLIWLKVRMPTKLWVGIIIGFVGMICILKPNQSIFSLISLIGVLCGILQGISVVAVRKLSTEPISRVFFYHFLVTTLISGCIAIQHWVPISRNDFVLLCGVGITTYLGQILFAYSCKFAHPTTLAPICYTSILYSGLIGWFVWHEIPDSSTQIGMLLVILGCILTVVMNRKTSTLVEPQTIQETPA